MSSFNSTKARKSCALAIFIEINQLTPVLLFTMLKRDKRYNEIIEINSLSLLCFVTIMYNHANKAAQLLDRPQLNFVDFVLV